MKGNTATYVPLNEIVNEALLDLGYSSHYKEQFLQWGLKYYRRLRRDMLREVKTVVLDMTPWKSIILPDDCVDWIAVGIKSGQMIKTFVNKPDLASRADGSDSSEPEEPTFDNVDMSGEGVQFYNFTEYGEDAGKLYGQLIKDNGLGYFNPNNHQGVNEIQLSAGINSGTRIYLMYLSTLFDPTSETIVHPYAQDYIGFGIHYENMKHRRRAGDRRITGDMVAEAKHERDEEYCLLAEMKCDWSIEAIIEVCRTAKRLTPKG